MSVETPNPPEDVTCAALVDALGRLRSHRADIAGFTSPTPDRVLFGVAVTVAFMPFRADLFDERRHSFGSLFYRAVSTAPDGKVLILSSGGYPDVSHGGGTKLSRADNVGLAGVVADGRLRDFDELAGYGFTTYCRGEATRAGVDTVMPFDANVPVEVAGVTIQPGDYVYFDRSGGVVIPATDLDRVLSGARAVQAEDDHARLSIRAELADEARRDDVHGL
jgi:regulator of RNase E activity RraA